MAVHGVFIAPRRRDRTAVDRELRELFAEVYRVGAEFWLVDCVLDAEDMARAIRTRLAREDKLFVAALSRDVWSGLSPQAGAWLVAPQRTWSRPDSRRGTAAPADAAPEFAAISLAA